MKTKAAQIQTKLEALGFTFTAGTDRRVFEREFPGNINVVITFPPAIQKNHLLVGIYDLDGDDLGVEPEVVSFDDISEAKIEELIQGAF